MAYRVEIPEHKVVELVSCETPSPNAGEVLIQTRTSLISPGTERAFYLGLPNTNPAFPLYPGYSNIGVVVGVGEGVENIHVGQRVASTAQHASHVVVSATNCIAVPEAVGDADAAFFNLIAIAMQAVHKARIELGESVAVIGAGMIGLFAMQLAKLSGGLPVAVIDKDPARLDLAINQMGADVSYRPDNIPTEFDVVIEASGASPAVITAFQIAAFRGRVVLLGSTRAETDGVNFYRDVHRKGLTIIGAHEMTRASHENFAGWWTQQSEQKLALELLALKRLTVAPLITHRFGWQQFPDAYQLLESWDKSAMGMVINWNNSG